MPLDLASLQSVVDFAKAFRQRCVRVVWFQLESMLLLYFLGVRWFRYQKIDLLVCNAGMALRPRALTADNFESQFQVCWLLKMS